MKKHAVKSSPGRFARLQQSKPIVAIQRGLMTLIPILMIGSFALVLKSLPLPGYQAFIAQWLGGALPRLFTAVYNVTFNLLAVYMTVMIGYHYGLLQSSAGGLQYGTMLVSVVVFGLLTNVSATNTDPLTAKGVFLAIPAAVLGSALFTAMLRRTRKVSLLFDGADVIFSSAVRMFFPLTLTTLVFALANALVLALTGAASVYELVLQAGNTALRTLGNGPAGGALFVFSSTLLWFFGIHGSNLLEAVSAQIFMPTSELAAAEAAGQAVTQILTKPFFDVFVLMGGCGATLGLLVALLLFSKRGGTRRLAKLAAVPMLFNVNEILVFGLPIVLNPMFFVPFLAMPLISFATSYLAVAAGLVPPVVHAVEWTTPVFISGYIATGSWAGVLLQGVNLALAVLVYRPFVKMYDDARLRDAERDYETLVEEMKRSERERTPLRLTEVATGYGWLAKALAADLPVACANGELKLHYQPQYHLDGHCIGAEALLRWNHPLLGLIYPPLVFQLAGETGYLPQLEEYVFETAANAAATLCSEADWVPGKQKLSVNITGLTMPTARFEAFVTRYAAAHPELTPMLCLELTEQAALQLNEEETQRFMRIHNLGYQLAIDDFSMGNTSVQYLVGGQFDLVKLDGGLVRGMQRSPRCKEIISSLVQLSGTLGFDVLAEFVETRELRDALAAVGCLQYQGWYYAKAMPLEALLMHPLEYDAELETEA